jgi:hypothetical protein
MKYYDSADQKWNRLWSRISRPARATDAQFLAFFIDRGKTMENFISVLSHFSTGGALGEPTCCTGSEIAEYRGHQKGSKKTHVIGHLTEEHLTQCLPGTGARETTTSIRHDPS